MKFNTHYNSSRIFFKNLQIITIKFVRISPNYLAIIKVWLYNRFIEQWSMYVVNEESYSLLGDNYMKSLIPKVAKSTFVTSGKSAFVCASLYTHLWETRYRSLYTRLRETQYRMYNIFVLLVIFVSEMHANGRR